MSKRTVAFLGLAAAMAWPAAATDRIRLENGELRKGDAPFFPLGFVFGTSDAELDHARELGANSVHAEYSIRDVLSGPGQVSPAGMERIRELHARVARHGLAFFPLLNGHYLPGWLASQAAGKPKDLNGQPIGLWFEESLHDPIFRKALEKYWSAVAGAVGDDPNVGAFVSWNEPAYGLDASPAALADFRGWLMLRYGPVKTLNEALGLHVKSYAQVRPPRAPEENRALWYAWVLFHQEVFADFFAWEHSVFRKVAPSASLSGKHPAFTFAGDAKYVNEGALQMRAQDLPGTDAYGGSLLQFRDALEATRSAARSAPVIVYETHPQRAHQPSSPDQSALQVFAQLIGGARGLFLFAFGSEDAEFGFESDAGTPPTTREKLRELFATIGREPSVFAAPRQPAEIGVVLSMASAIQYGSGPDTAQRDEYSKRVGHTFDLIRNQHYAVDFVWDRMLVPERLKQYRLLVLPSLTILRSDQIEALSQFTGNGGRILAFGGALERDELFRKIPLPGLLGVSARGPAKWDRGAARLTDVVPALAPVFATEITVQRPELIAGFETGTLAAGQDAQPMIQTSEHATYCAFDSLYSEELSRLMGGLLESQGFRREVSVRNREWEATEILTSVSARDRQRIILIANSGPRSGEWTLRWPDARDGSWRSVRTSTHLPMKDGEMALHLPEYGWDALVLE